MDGIRFILEDPQAANSRQKKRSRLVTACDTCRAKKIKCHQSPNSSKCEACRLSKSACRFRDRDRYHAQRSGSLSASSSTFNPSDSEDTHSFTESPNVAGRRATLPSFGNYHLQHPRSSSLPPALPRLPLGAVADLVANRSGSPSSEVGPLRMRKISSRRVIGAVTSSGRSNLHKGRSLTHSTPALPGFSPLSGLRDLALEDFTGDMSLLFDATRLGFPTQDYMNQGLDLFFEFFGLRFLFLHRDALRRAVMEHSLTAPFANCIVALGLRFSQSTDISGSPHLQAADPFLDMAKDLIVPSVYTPTIETLHSLLLLSWGEYGSGRENGLNLYSALAVQMATDLNLGIEETIQSVPTAHEQLQLRQTWWSVVTLDIISSWVTGNPPNLDLRGCSTVLPPSSSPSSEQATSQSLTYFILHEMLGLRDQLLQAVNVNITMDAYHDYNGVLQDVRSRLLCIQSSLPSYLNFSIVNLRRAYQDHEETAFLFLHLILNCLIAMSHCPSLLRSVPCPPFIPEIVSSSARTVLDAVVMMDQIDARTINAIPFLDLPLTLVARVFAIENCTEQQETTHSQAKPSAVNRSRFAGISLGVCNNLLARLAEHWGNVRNVQVAVQSGTVWSFICPVQQSPVAIPSALDLRNVETFSQLPQVHIDPSEDHHEVGLTYSDSEISREASPLIFHFPGSLSSSTNGRADYDQLQRPASDPTPTTLLPPVSLASGEIVHYDDFSTYVTPYSEAGYSAGGQEVDYFSLLPGGDCLSGGQGNPDLVAPSFPHSPWLFS